MASTAKWAVSTITLPSRYVVAFVMSSRNSQVSGNCRPETNSASGQVGGLAGLGAIAGAAALGLDFLNIPSFISIGLASVVAGNVHSVPSGSAVRLYLVVPCRSGCTILPLLRRLAKGAEESR